MIGMFAEAIPAIAWAGVCVFFTVVGLLVGWATHLWNR